jgi:purine-nucleoside phosphorylase
LGYALKVQFYQHAERVMSLGKFLEAMEGGLPKRIILTDDPLRVKMLVAHHLEYARLVSELRGMSAYVGEYESARIAVLGVGYGEPALLAWLSEAIEYGASAAVYIGECVSQSEDLSLRDVVLASAAYGARGFAAADAGLVDEAALVAKKLDFVARLAEVFTDDTYWLDEDKAANSGKPAIDFATDAFYWKSAFEGIKALSILTVSEDAISGRRIDEAERQSRFNNASRLAFELLARVDA